MNSENTDAVSVGDRDDLLQLEIRIAQRADALSQGSGNGGSTDLIHWIQAEREVFEQYLGLGQDAAAAAGR